MISHSIKYCKGMMNQARTSLTLQRSRFLSILKIEDADRSGGNKCKSLRFSICTIPVGMNADRQLDLGLKALKATTCSRRDSFPSWNELLVLDHSQIKRFIPTSCSKQNKVARLGLVYIICSSCSPHSCLLFLYCDETPCEDENKLEIEAEAVCCYI